MWSTGASLFFLISCMLARCSRQCGGSFEGCFGVADKGLLGFEAERKKSVMAPCFSTFLLLLFGGCSSKEYELEDEAPVVVVDEVSVSGGWPPAPARSYSSEM